MNPARLLGAIEKITRYNQKLFPMRIDGTNYPTIAERRSFARKVAAWFQADRLAADARVGIPEFLPQIADARRVAGGDSGIVDDLRAKASAP